MLISRLTALRIAALALPAFAASTVLAQGALRSVSGQNTYLGLASTAPDTQTKSAYKKTTWQTYQNALKGGSTSREIPPTDCPPLPVQDCLDTWDEKLTTSKPSE